MLARASLVFDVKGLDELRVLQEAALRYHLKLVVDAEVLIGLLVERRKLQTESGESSRPASTYAKCQSQRCGRQMLQCWDGADATDCFVWH